MKLKYRVQSEDFRQRLTLLQRRVKQLENSLLEKDHEIANLNAVIDHLTVTKRYRQLMLQKTQTHRHQSLHSSKPTRIQEQKKLVFGNKPKYQLIRYEKQLVSSYLYKQRYENSLQKYNALYHVNQIRQLIGKVELINRKQLQHLDNSLRQIIDEHYVYFKHIQFMKLFVKFNCQLQSFLTTEDTVKQLQRILSIVCECKKAVAVIFSNQNKQYYYIEQGVRYDLSSTDLSCFGNINTSKIFSKQEIPSQASSLPFIKMALESLFIFPIINQHSRCFIFFANTEKAKFDLNDQNFMRLMSKLCLCRLIMRFEQVSTSNRDHFFSYIQMGLQKMIATNSVRSLFFQLQDVILNIFKVQKCKIIFKTQQTFLVVDQDKNVDSCTPIGVFFKTLQQKLPIVVLSPYTCDFYEVSLDLNTQQPLISYPLISKNVCYAVVQISFGKFMRHAGQKQKKTHLPNAETEAMQFLAMATYELLLKLDK